MKQLEERIIEEGKTYGNENLKVDSFLNHQVDVALAEAMADEWYRLFKDEGITRILTIEASGIPLACFTARLFGVPMVFAKKNRTGERKTDAYSARVISFTHGIEYEFTVDKEYLGPDDKVLIIDDILANGASLCGLVGICRQAGAQVAGAGVAIEKTFQTGGETVRDLGIRIEPLVRISGINKDGTVEIG